jgi:hypothetical protein
VCPTWDWRHVPDRFSAKTGYPGMNLQIAATLDGELAAVGPVPVHGARHDAYAFAASGLAEVLTDHPTVADLGYLGVDGEAPVVDIEAGPEERVRLGSETHTEQQETVGGEVRSAASEVDADAPKVRGR